MYSKIIIDKLVEIPLLKTFEPVEVNILEYLEDRGSNIDFHFDDFWLWGERIVGLNLVNAAIMTFKRPDDNDI